MAKTAFIGLGVMGGPMAGHLSRAGHDVAVYNRSEEKARDWAQKHKGRTYTSVANACDGVDIVFSCVGNDRDVRSVLLGEHGVLEGIASGAVVVDHTTASAVVAGEPSICGNPGRIPESMTATITPWPAMPAACSG